MAGHAAQVPAVGAGVPSAVADGGIQGDGIGPLTGVAVAGMARHRTWPGIGHVIPNASGGRRTLGLTR